MEQRVSRFHVLDPAHFAHHVERFNDRDDETFVHHIANRKAWGFLCANVPLFSCPDPDIEEIYYFRWWVFRKSIKLTADGFVVLEFQMDVPWAGKYNAISLPAGMHLYEGRWLRETTYLDHYSHYWYRWGGNPLAYPTYLADGIWARTQVTGRYDVPTDLLPHLVQKHEEREQMNLHPCGLFWSHDNGEGEISISGMGFRLVLNYCDLVISGLVGLRPRADDVLEVNPLVPEGTWDYFCLDGVTYHGRDMTILFDRTGDHFGRGSGLRVWVDGELAGSAAGLQRVLCALTPSGSAPSGPG